MGEEGGIAFLANEVADAMVVRSAAGVVRHRAGIDCRRRWRKRARVGEREEEMLTMSRWLRLRRDVC